MSQAKVDKYKEYKRNRRENIRKEKQKAFRNKMIALGIILLIVVGVGAAIGVSIYNSYQAKLAAMPTYGAQDFLLSDYAGIQVTDEEETEAETEVETEAETETEVETEAQAEVETEAETEAETEVESETEVETETDVETETTAAE
ncbi:MAG: hypothetical protein IJ468_08980 [Lachnospiraceae bacterium]|nr:hypothetical protein [Lachnospiraceae bacterium]